MMMMMMMMMMMNGLKTSQSDEICVARSSII